MNSLDTYLQLMASRAELLTLVMVGAYGVGEFLARGPLHAMLARGTRVVERLGHKLGREHRGAATLVYRGMVAVFMLLIPAMLLGAITASAAPLPPALGMLVTVLVLAAWFGHGFATHRMVQRWRQSRTSGLPLEYPGLDYLFADSHAVIRYSVSARMEAFAVSIVGGGFWFLLGGLPLMAAYLTLAAAASAYRQRVAFGWAARSLFGLMDVLPRILSLILLRLASLFTPHTHPLAGLGSGRFTTQIARMLGVALGGPGPGGDAPWVGTGTARLTPTHLGRALALMGVASLLLCLLLASPNIFKLLATIN